MKAKQKRQVLVVCHDAGAGQVISSYVRKHVARHRFYCLVLGPAQKIFSSKGLSRLAVSRAQGNKILDKGRIDMVLCGTSWVSSIGREFLKKAKSKSVKSVVYLDHWTNYRERFGYPRKNWQKNLPDELWVGDRHAEKLAKQCFKNRTVRLVPNGHFQEVKAAYQRIRASGRTKGNDVLFISEPTMLAHKTFYEAGYVFDETDVLKRVLDHLSKKNIKDSIVICYHPAEKKDKYGSLLARYAGTLRFRKQGSNLLEDFARAKLVIGRRSMALALAALCGRKVVSYIPDRKVAFPLPFKEIMKIRDINRLKV